jgi:hypothetical protein
MIQRCLVTIAMTTFSAAAVAGLFGPAKFQITQADTRFSEAQEIVWTSANNRISKKSIVGGTHLDASGVYVNPMVRLDKNTGAVVSLGLVILNRTSYDTTYGAPNTLGIPREIVFLLNDTKPIALAISEGDYSWSDTTSYNSVSMSASKNILESGLAQLTPDQYQEIVSSDSLAVKIVGSKRSVTYEAKDLQSSFVTNLRTFYDEKVKTGLSAQ